MNNTQFKSITYTGIKSGLRLIVLGAVHGNEICGTLAIEKIIQEFETKRRTIIAGSVTFVPIANPLAYDKKQRIGDRNLNRNLNPTPQPQDFEDHVTNWLCPLLAQHDVLLDLHSFHTLGKPFALIGPRNNTGVLEPFNLAAEEEALALRLGVNVFVDGWLDTYSRGVAHRVANQAAYPNQSKLQNLDVKYGVGTTEYMRSQGGWGITLECGQHEEASAPEVAYNAIYNTLAHLGLIDAPAPKIVSDFRNLRIIEVIDKTNAEDQFIQAWKSFDALKTGDVIGVRKNGEQVMAEFDAIILFPNPAAFAGNEWFYLAKMVTRF
ncbi:MAG: succinylglutamate desuccinylase/aspartoacylase family protein [Methylococcaceae bacterium]|nr:succinylglutamate desuccinylase/aspartoacylase family protein [Methylococcaceae bacterium]